MRLIKPWAHTIIGLAMIFVLGDSICQSATTVPDHPLTLKECVRFAIEQNPSAASALHSGRAAMARVGSSRSAYWPTLGINGAFSESYTRPPSGANGNNGIASSSATLTGQYTLWDSGLRKAGLGGAQATYEATDARYASTVQDLAVSVESTYFVLQGAEWALQVAQETLKQADFHLDMAKARNDVGLSPRSDVHA